MLQYIRIEAQAHSLFRHGFPWTHRADQFVALPNLSALKPFAIEPWRGVHTITTKRPRNHPAVMNRGSS